jgi:hypothetical protein
LPTQKQSNTAIFVCQLLSNLYQPIQIFRYDRQLKTLYVQAGATDGIALIIEVAGLSPAGRPPATVDEEGIWDFVT